MNKTQRQYLHGSADWSCFGSEFSDDVTAADPLNTLSYYTVEHNASKAEGSPSDLRLLAEVYQKLIYRGSRTYLQPDVEALLFHLLPKRLQPKVDHDKPHDIAYTAPERLKAHYLLLTSFTDPLQLPDTKDYNPFDPDNPQNEQRFYEQLVEIGGAHLASYIYPQCRLDQLLPKEAAKAFQSQRLDFLVMLPDGKGVVFEPGDHDLTDEGRDTNREAVCRTELGIETVRIDNSAIGTAKTAKRIKDSLSKIGAANYLNRASAEDHFLLSPFALHRVEAALLDALLNRQLIEGEALSIGIHTGNQPCAEIAVYSFFRRLENLWKLYGFTPPSIKQIRCINYGTQLDSSHVEECQKKLNELELFEIQVVPRATQQDSLDLFIDVSVQASYLKPIYPNVDATWSYCIRNCFRHTSLPTFRANTERRWIDIDHLDEDKLNPFVQECFRKQCLRPDQVRVLKHLLSQGDTIGLLPTGGGKSMCYQMSGLLTPGVCLIVDPLVALMDDQVASLQRRSRVTHVRALHSGSRIKDKSGLIELMRSYLFVFISPERFLRQNFRQALFAASQSGYRIGLTVIDEAHCVSMWGHDFRPAYLELAKNIRRYAVSGGAPPPILALSGTASQLVLIDLARQLGIHGSEAIIRPNTFERKELHYRVLATSKSKKAERLIAILKETSKKLKSKDLLKDQYGMIFGTTRGSVFDAFSWIFGDQQAEQLLCPPEDRPAELGDINAGIYTGSAPREIGASDREWQSYKKSIFEQFVSGRVRCMIANNALSVGIDHPRIRYVINLSMPASLESYYQQAGRAGRDGSKSYCDLIFSDDTPEATDDWINNKPNSKYLSGDVSTLSYFHDMNFPGIEEDQRVLSTLVRIVFKKLKTNPGQQISLAAEDTELLTSNSRSKYSIDSLGRFIGYLTILGMIDGYTVSGMARNTVYLLDIPAALQKHLEDGDFELAQLHTLESLHSYYCRYEPTDFTTLTSRVQAAADKSYNGSISMAACEHLISFIYARIAYQRRESIRTMVQYCRLASKEPKKARKFIQGYFDRSKFSDTLEALRNGTVSLGTSLGILQTIKDYEDAEQLFWETRRLLDESPRGDWHFISIFAEAYSGRDQSEDTVRKILRFITDHRELAENETGQIVEAIAWVVNATAERHYTTKVLLAPLIHDAYANESTRELALNILDSNELALNGPLQESISQQIFNTQLERLLYVTKQES